MKKLYADINKKLGTREYGSYTLKGVKNLSYADLETLQLYAEFAMNGRLHELMPLRGNLAEVWKKYGGAE